VFPIGLERGLLETQEGRLGAPLGKRSDRVRYGQAPVRMSAPGPAFFHVSDPTVLWMQ
jgi:hypothetical protein